MESVSSDGGEYQDLPIIVDSAGKMNTGIDLEQGMNSTAGQANTMKASYQSREMSIDQQ